MLWILLACLGCAASTMLPSFYHSAEHILDQLDDFECDGKKLTKQVERVDSYELLYYTLETSGNTIPTLIVFGEHPREIIAPEIIPSLLDAICKPNHHRTHIIPFFNQRGRTALEDNGDWCIRNNLEGIDVNRDWPRPGAAGAMSMEVRAGKSLVDKLNPRILISVHSGQQAILLPNRMKKSKSWEDNSEYNSAETVNRKIDLMELAIPKVAQKNYSVGSIDEVSKYTTEGNMVDYVTRAKKLNVDFAYGIEIYKGTSRQLKFQHIPKSLDPVNETLKCLTNFNPVAPEGHTAAIEAGGIIVASMVHEAQDMYAGRRVIN